MRFLLSAFIAFSLSFSPSTHAGVAAVDLKEFVTEFNTPKGKASFLEARPEYQKLLKAHSLQNEKLPTAELLDNDIVFKEYPEYKFRFTPGGDLQVWMKEKSVDLESSMTFEEMKLKIESLGSTKKFSFMSLIISDAYAASGITILVVAAILLYGAYSFARSSKFSVTSAMDLKKCKMAENEGSSISKADAVGAYNQLTDAFLKMCVSKSVSKDGCENIKQTKVCYKKLIDADGSIVEGERSSEDFFYSPKEDKFKTGTSRQ